MAINFCSIGDLDVATSVSDNYKLLIDDGTDDAKTITANNLKTYTLGNIQNNLALKADKAELHKHNNQNILDNLTTDNNGNLLYSDKTLATSGDINEINTSLTNSLSYTYGEVATGNIYIDGKKIYKKSLYLHVLDNSDSHVSISDLNFENIVSINTVGSTADGNITIPIPYLYSQDDGVLQSASVWRVYNDLYARIKNIAEMHVLVTIEYTKL